MLNNRIKSRFTIIAIIAFSIILACFRIVGAAWQEPALLCEPPNCNRPTPLYKQSAEQEGPLNIKDIVASSGKGTIEANKYCLCSGVTGNCSADKCISSWTESGIWTKDPVSSKVYYNDANVGIGTATPAEKLEIVTGTRSMLALKGDPNTNWVGTIIKDTSGNEKWFMGANGNKLLFRRNGATNDMVIDTNGNIGINTASPVGKLNINSGDLIYTNNNSYGAWRYGAKLSALAGLKGRQINNNTDFLEGLSTYNVYDNGASGSISFSLLTDDTVPNTSGRVMQIDHNTSGTPSPGWGGFYKAFSKCAGISVGQCYREGNRIVYRIWAKIPSGYAINFASNGFGDGGTHVWISSQSGTGNWEEYIAVQTIGSGGSFSSTGFWYISGGTRPFTWYVASVDIIDVDQPADVDRVSELNVGYKKDIALGTGSLLTTNSTYLAADGGNVGIGTTGPAAKLQINPPANTEGLRIITSNYSPFVIRNAADNADIFRVDQSGNLTITGSVSGLNIGGWTKSGNIIYATDVSDKVGIGTAAPNAKLTVIAAGAFDQFSLVNSAYYSGGWARGADMQFIRNDSSRHRGLTYGILGSGDGSNGAYFSAVVDDANPWSTAQLFLNSSGNVGIGTVSSGAPLHVSGVNDRESPSVPAQFMVSDSGDITKRLQLGYEDSWDAGVISAVDAGTAWKNLILQPHGGNVGIGTASPSEKLQVAGNIKLGGTEGDVKDINQLIGYNDLFIKGNSEEAAPIYYGASEHKFYTGGTQKLTILNNGNVGIGTTAPGAKLEVKHSGSGEGTSVFPSGEWAAKVFMTQDSSNYGGLVVGSRWANNDNIVFQAGNLFNSWNPYFTVKGGGNVGIGTITPSEKLEVAGNTNITGNLTIGGTFSAASGAADLAEEFTTKEEIEKGTVLIMGDDGYKSAKPCDSEYDTKVIGVVSDNAAVIMGVVASEYKAVVTISGVVTVKVSVKNGIIKKGDLLTTSDINGYAMKAIDAKIGTVIGKALEECSNDKCNIKALINLQ